MMAPTKPSRSGLPTAPLILATAFCGCNMNAPAPPDIPPASTFLMDFGPFANGMDAKNATVVGNPAAEQVITGGNWGWAALNVGVWNVIITAGLAVPVAAYLESFNHAPDLRDDGTWVWSYEFTALGAQHRAELHGLIVGNDVEWNMFITKEDTFSDFNWYSGVSTLTRTEGTWTLNKEPQEPVPFIDIDWHRNEGDNTADIRYTNVEPGSPENGGYITFGRTAGEPYNAYYEIFKQGEANLVEIEWNRDTRAGRVRDFNHFGDDEWHCWDADLQNTPCPDSAG